MYDQLVIKNHGDLNHHRRQKKHKYKNKLDSSTSDTLILIDNIQDEETSNVSNSQGNLIHQENSFHNSTPEITGYNFVHQDFCGGHNLNVTVTPKIPKPILNLDLTDTGEVLTEQNLISSVSTSEFLSFKGSNTFFNTPPSSNNKLERILTEEKIPKLSQLSKSLQNINEHKTILLHNLSMCGNKEFDKTEQNRRCRIPLPSSTLKKFDNIKPLDCIETEDIDFKLTNKLNGYYVKDSSLEFGDASLDGCERKTDIVINKMKKLSLQEANYSAEVNMETKKDDISIAMPSTNSCQEPNGKKSLIKTRLIESSLSRAFGFCNWIFGKCFLWIRNGITRIRDLFSVIKTVKNPKTLVHNDIVTIEAIVKGTNDQLLCIVREEIAQIRVINEIGLKNLLQELREMRSENQKFFDQNQILRDNLKSLNEFVMKIKLNPVSTNGIVPPPPPPPPPTPLFLLKTPIKSNGSTSKKTPVSNKTLRTNSAKKKTPKKATSTQPGRLTITVEDLKRVNLKKAPQNKKENRRHTVPGSRGPIISLDMLKSVKLKPTCRKSPRRSETKLSISDINEEQTF